MKNASTETWVVHGGEITQATRDLAPPIHPASTFERAADGTYPGKHMYSRISTPAYEQLEDLLRRLEGGADAQVFASGMAAGSAILQALRAGERLVVPRAMYWGMRNWIVHFASAFGIGLAFYANDDLNDLEAQLAKKPAKLLWIETPANPTWDVTDIQAASELAHHYGALALVDSTIASPALSRPLSLGADFVLHSATKYMNGHSDLVAGALIAKEDSDFWQRVRFARTHAGSVLGAFEAWLLTRGLRTLFIRVRTASSNALRIARELGRYSGISHVLYPGLPSHPGHGVALKQMEGGFGGMLSVRFRVGEKKARDVAARLKIFKRATSLGSVESLVEHRASIEGPGTLCPGDLLRFSVGIEPVDDLLMDIDQAIEARC
ncbi:MAG: aminotransferase class I/II-fold pyridoxal phosphate-dependent enzyme [Candidatus Accumulibacter sp.]|jgi:cystathionine gamma-synthase|nr:aminotransferase class I/II-fold pyridoxal phosphate-dependent enzyme [Accumulibacter sp.]